MPDNDKASKAAVEQSLYLVAAITRGGVATRPGADLSGPIANINKIAAEANARTLSHEQQTILDSATLALMAAIAPATIQSLRDTDPHIPTENRTLHRLGSYEALAFSRGLWVWSFIFIAIAVFGNWLLACEGKACEINDECLRGWTLLFQILTPFTYGALGATAALLRILHTYIYDRTYDRRRKPEYYNRILLGTIAGGVIAMFVEVQADAEAKALTSKLSAGALGFLAGYSTDFLYSTIERITSALFPKVTVEPERPGRGRTISAASTAPSLDELLGRLTAARTEDERAKIGELIDRYYPGGQY